MRKLLFILLTPVFCDIDPNDFTIDVTKLETLITDKTSAIIPVHVYGYICNVEEIQRIAKKYDLKPICFHELRHTSASILIHKGINPKAVSDRLGHTTTNMTMEIYSHAFNSAMQESANIFDTVLKNA